MKKLILKLLAIVVISGIVFTSCDNNNSDDILTGAQALTEEEINTLIESDGISNEIDNFLEVFITDVFNVSGKDDVAKDIESQRVVPDCFIKTVVEQGATKIITVDFGEGCKFPFDNVLAGKIIMTCIYNLEANTATITTTFEGFTFNEVMIEGENIMIGIKSNNNGNPQSEITMNVKHTWPDGEFTSIKGTVIREWTEGADTDKNWEDNVFIITGVKTITFKDGTVCTSEVIDGLRREVTCGFIVSGILKLTKGEKSGLLNFGDGSCDDKAVFTNSNGDEKEIILRKRK